MLAHERRCACLSKHVFVRTSAYVVFLMLPNTITTVGDPLHGVFKETCDKEVTSELIGEEAMFCIDF